MPWTIWTILALVFMLFDTLIRFIRFRDDPKAWTLGAAAAGAVLWGVAWFVLASALHGSMAAASLQAALFCGVYIAIVLIVGKRLLAHP